MKGNSSKSRKLSQDRELMDKKVVKISHDKGQHFQANCLQNCFQNLQCLSNCSWNFSLNNWLIFLLVKKLKELNKFLFHLKKWNSPFGNFFSGLSVLQRLLFSSRATKQIWKTPAFTNKAGHLQLQQRFLSLQWNFKDSFIKNTKMTN